MNPTAAYLRAYSDEFAKALDRSLISLLKNPTMFKHYVALEVDGVPKFSTAPVAHANRMSAAAEADRLSRVHPGKTFGIYTRNDDASSTFRHVPEYTGAQLFNGAAPAGLYKPLDGFGLRLGEVRLFATGHSNLDRRVLYLRAATADFTAEPATRHAWLSTTFRKVDERLSFVKTP